MRITYGLIGQPEITVFDKPVDVVRIGADPTNDIVLSNPHVSPRHAVLSRHGVHWELTPLGENDILVGNHTLRYGERAVIGLREPISIFPFLLSFDSPGLGTNQKTREELLDDQLSELVLAVHGDLLSRLHVDDTDESRRESETFLQQLEADIDELARLRGFLDPPAHDLLVHGAAHTVRGAILGRIVEGVTLHDIWDIGGKWTKLYTASPELERELVALATLLERNIDPRQTADISEKMERIAERFWTIWNAELKSKNLIGSNTFLQYLGQRYIKKQIKDIVFGYGPLEDLIRMPNISEIMVVSQDKIYVEKNGVLEKSGRRFVSDEVTESIINRIVNRVSRRIDKSQPLVDARLTDGSRVNAIIAPIALNGPCLTIRKFPAKKLTVEDLISFGALTPVVSKFLEAAVISGRNMLISGGTGSGKTTLLNCLSDYIPEKERIVTIEDTAELQLKKEHVVRLETKAANVEGVGQYTIRDLVKNALRMRPDRIVVGECRGPEALDMLQAMNTGHDGSMTTIHANTAEDVIGRLEVLVLTAADLPVESIHRQIASAIDIVVQLRRLRDGRRVVSQVTEFMEYDKSERCIRTKDLFMLDSESPHAQLLPTGSLPTFIGELMENDLIDLASFYR